MSEKKILTLNENNVAYNGITADEIVVTGENVTLEGCTAKTVKVEADKFVARACEVASLSLVGAENALVAQSRLGALALENCFNCSLVLNTADAINVTASKNIYVIENTVAGELAINNCNYVIADVNTFGALKAENNANVNGDTLTDITARSEVGANFDILPHTNKDLFVYMDRRSTVANTALSIGDYIFSCASKGDNAIIVPPGVYSIYETLVIGKEYSDFTLYAYGVYLENAETDTTKIQGTCFRITDTKNINVRGLTMGYVQPSSGQVRIVEKKIAQTANGTEHQLTVISDSGFLDGFTKTDPAIFHTWWPEIFYSDENGNGKPYAQFNMQDSHGIVRNIDENGNYDGTMTLTIYNRGNDVRCSTVPASYVYNKVKPGDIITCRYSHGGGSTLNVTNSSSEIHFKDTVIYGRAGSLSVVSGSRSYNVTFERHHNTTHSASVIDKETYDRYKAYEEKYGVSFELREEEYKGKTFYRGSTSRVCSIDAFHCPGGKNGVSILSTITESMVDDGSNQRASSSRLHAYKVNDDGTTTLFYKPLLGSTYWWYSRNDPEDKLSTVSCPNFLEGDRIYIYNPGGKKVIDSYALCNAVEECELVYDLTYGDVHKHVIRKLMAVKVNTADVDFDALKNPATGEDYKLEENGYETEDRVTVDNLSANSCGYTIENSVVRNSCSRGYLMKATDVNVKNCTFQNVGGVCLLITVEPSWGESTVARDIYIDRCLFDHCGILYDAFADINRANIHIAGPSKIASRDTLPIKNISIENCKFTNNEQWHAITINSAQNVKIKNNTFDRIVDEWDEIKDTAVLLNTCMDIEISDNTYNLDGYKGDIRNIVYGKNYKLIHGTDVTNPDGTPMIPDSEE